MEKSGKPGNWFVLDLYEKISLTILDKEILHITNIKEKLQFVGLMCGVFFLTFNKDKFSATEMIGPFSHRTLAALTIPTACAIAAQNMEITLVSYVLTKIFQNLF